MSAPNVRNCDDFLMPYHTSSRRITHKPTHTSAPISPRHTPSPKPAQRDRSGRCASWAFLADPTQFRTGEKEQECSRTAGVVFGYGTRIGLFLHFSSFIHESLVLPLHNATQLFDLKTEIPDSEYATFADFHVSDDALPNFCGFRSLIQALNRDDSHSEVDLETRAQVKHKSMEIPGDAVPSDKHSKNIGARVEAEYLQIILSWIFVCLNLLFQGFSMCISTLRSGIQEDSSSDILLGFYDELVEPYEAADDPADFCEQEDIESRGETIPPDNNFTLNSDPFTRSEYSFDSKLTHGVFQEVDNRPTTAPEFEPDSDRHHLSDRQHNLRKPFISFEPSIDETRNHEPFERAESQSFFPCACYVDYPPLRPCEASSESTPEPDQVFEEIIAPVTDAVPPNKDSASIRIRFEAEYLQFIASSIFAWWLNSFSRARFTLKSPVHADPQDDPNSEDPYRTADDSTDILLIHG
ncbi:hypothetical protein B0H19DRAFT_1084952 [Mycena capillaripes]|nr:hypothetical protein B0H19DRAFT_1084952 [Mycena capillaripes]